MHIVTAVRQAERISIDRLVESLGLKRSGPVRFSPKRESCFVLRPSVQCGRSPRKSFDRDACCWILSVTACPPASMERELGRVSWVVRHEDQTICAGRGVESIDPVRLRTTARGAQRVVQAQRRPWRVCEWFSTTTLVLRRWMLPTTRATRPRTAA